MDIPPTAPLQAGYVDISPSTTGAREGMANPLYAAAYSDEEDV